MKEESYMIKTICAQISVNSWPIERTNGIIADLKTNGLFDLGVLIKEDVIAIGNRLKRSNYDRGALTYMIAERLLKTVTFIHENNVYRDLEIDLSNKSKQSTEFLNSIPGFGPKTIDNFFNVKE